MNQLLVYLMPCLGLINLASSRMFYMNAVYLHSLLALVSTSFSLEIFIASSLLHANQLTFYNLLLRPQNLRQA